LPSVAESSRYRSVAGSPASAGDKKPATAVAARKDRSRHIKGFKRAIVGSEAPTAIVGPERPSGP
jgi:hypothetical protein